VNKYLSQQEPWKRTENNQERYRTIVYVACEAIRITVLCLWPFLPRTAEAVLKALGAPAPLETDPEKIFRVGLLAPGMKITVAGNHGVLKSGSVHPKPAPCHISLCPIATFERLNHYCPGLLKSVCCQAGAGRRCAEDQPRRGVLRIGDGFVKDLVFDVTIGIRRNLRRFEFA
jgi:hypothetical protein